MTRPKFITKPFPLYDDIADLCDTVTATGAGAFRVKVPKGIDQVNSMLRVRGGCWSRKVWFSEEEDGWI